MGAATDAATEKSKNSMMPPQRKHEQPLARRIQCLRRLKLETTEPDRGGRIGGVRQRRQRNRGAGSANGCNWNGEHRDRGHRRDSELDLRAALIFRVALLQTGVLVDGLAAIAVVIGLCKGHGWRRRSLDTGMCKADRLGEKHPCREKAADFTTNSGTAKNHTPSRQQDSRLHCRPRTGAMSSRLNGLRYYQNSRLPANVRGTRKWRLCWKL